MKINLAILACVLALFIFTGDVFAANLSLLNTSGDSGIVRQPLGAVPGVDGRIIKQNVTSVATTKPPTLEPVLTSPPPETEEKGICGPTSLTVLALIPLILKRKLKSFACA